MKRAVLALLLVACTRPAEQRALGDLEIGHASFSGADIEIAGGLAAVRGFTDHRLELWAQAPVLDLSLTVDASTAGAWTIVVRNVLPDAQLITAGVPITRAPGELPTVATFELTLAPGRHALRLAPPDADVIEPFRVASMADIQKALPDVDEVFAQISAEPDARFVIAMGDITERAEIEEYELFERQLATLDIPFYSTIGNHELWADPARFWDRFGRMNFHFTFKGAAFTFVDSGDAGLDPVVEDWLDDWLAGASDRAHVFLTHMAPVDPVGTRYGAFRSSRDGRRLLSRLAEGGVDLTLYGHIHTYIAFENAGIPAYVSGGGGADPMKFDGIDRHYLVVDIDPAAAAIGTVDLRRVD